MRFYNLIVHNLTVYMQLQDNAIYLVTPFSDEVGIPDIFIDEVSAWCDEHDCGIRSGYRSFKFDNEEQLTVFLLRWN